jgi:hypothetical protein
VSKILNGTKPADLPVQQAVKFELIINLKTAKAIGVDMSTAIQLRADDVIVPRRLAICIAQALSQDHFFERIMA